MGRMIASQVKFKPFARSARERKNPNPPSRLVKREIGRNLNEEKFLRQCKTKTGTLSNAGLKIKSYGFSKPPVQTQLKIIRNQRIRLKVLRQGFTHTEVYVIFAQGKSGLQAKE